MVIMIIELVHQYTHLIVNVLKLNNMKIAHLILTILVALSTIFCITHDYLFLAIAATLTSGWLTIKYQQKYCEDLKQNPPVYTDEGDYPFRSGC